ncbi:MAG: LysR family transcriptional regulator [Candidatus Adiutrix intracellularis]|nr:LysR family transcriptional regulator [Candidatus Adiutrix intracellularis]
MFGPGRLELLQNTEMLGSLHKAANAMGMSYRGAWGRIRSSEKNMGLTLLAHGGSETHGRIKVLTPKGRELIKWYKEVEKKIMFLVKSEFINMPGFLKNDEINKV